VIYQSPDREWTVEPIMLAAAPRGRDGPWLKVSYYGTLAGDVRTVAELDDYPFSVQHLTLVTASGPQPLRARRHGPENPHDTSSHMSV